MSIASELGIQDDFEEQFRRNQERFAKRIADPFYGLEGFKDPAEDQPKYPALPPDEAEGFRSKLIGAGASLLGQIGGALDKLGPRQIRALASGHLEDIPQSLIPFGGNLGLENPEHNLSWDQILTGKGRILPQIIPENDPTKYEWRDLVPLAFDVFASPGLPQLGALTKAGKIAEAAGELPRTLAQSVRGFSKLTPEVEAAINAPRVAAQAWKAPVAASENLLSRAAKAGLEESDVIGAPLRSGVKFSMLPFGGGPSVEFGGGKVTQGAADLLTGLSQNLQFSPTLLGKKNPIPVLRSLFDWKAGRAIDPEVQFSNITKAVPTRAAAEDMAARHEIQIRDALQKVYQEHGLGSKEDQAAVANYIRDRIEGVVPDPNVPLAGGLATAAPQLDEIANMMKGGVDYVREESLKRGYPFKDYNDEYLNYFTRQSLAPTAASQVGPKFQSIGSQIWGGQTPSQAKRMEVFRDLPIGTTGISRLSTDPNVVGAARLRGQAVTDYLRNIIQPAAERSAAGPLAAEQLAALEAKYPLLAKRLGKLSPDRLTPEGNPLFNVDTVSDLMARYGRFGKSAGATEAAYDLVRRLARPIEAGDMPISDVVKKLGLSSPDEILRQIGQGGVVGTPEAQAALKRFGLPAKQAEEMFAAQTKYLTPHELGPVMKGWQDAQNLFKSMVYGIFPSSHVRNFTSGVFNNWVSGAADPRFLGYGPRDWFGLRRYVQPELDIRRLLRGGEVEGFDRTKLLEDLFAGKALGEGGIHSDLLPGQAQRFANEGVSRAIAGQPVTPTIAESVKSGLSPYADALRLRRPEEGWRSLLPWAKKETAPGSGVWESINPLVNAGQEVARTVENNLRGGQMLAFLRQGWDPAAAARRVSETHFNYQQLAPFEQNVMKSLIPFYTFTRKNIPYQVSQLLENPNKAGQTIRIMDSLRGGKYVPSYLSSGFALPAGPQSETGEQRFVSSFGLPIEEAFSRFHPNSVRDTAQEFFGMLNPYLKGAAEQVFGRQLHTQRDLEDLDPGKVASGFGLIQGRPAQILSQIVMNSPAARVASTVNQLADERKDMLTKMLNLGTGVKLSDVNVTSARMNEARRALESLMKGNPNLKVATDFYLPKDKYEEVRTSDPATIQLMSLYKQFAKEAQAAHKAKQALLANQGL